MRPEKSGLEVDQEEIITRPFWGCLVEHSGADWQRAAIEYRDRLRALRLIFSTVQD